MDGPYTVGLARSSSWRDALDEALAGLSAHRRRSGTGLVYVHEGFADALDTIVDELGRRAGVATWFGAVSSAVFGADQRAAGEGTLAIMITPWNPADLHVVGGGRPARELLDRTSPPRVALVHGDRRLRQALAEIALQLPDIMAVGGIAASHRSPIQVLHRPAEDDLGAIVLAASVRVVAGISQACSPIGPSHEVSAAGGSWIHRLDQRPAYEVLAEETGEILSRQPERIGGYIHIELAGPDDDRVVRPILALEPRSGEIATTETVRRGQRLRFVKRDGEAARTSFAAMLERLQNDLDGRPPLAALYVASRARLTGLFEDPASEVEVLRKALGPLPLIGFGSDGEIFNARLHDWSSILVLFA